jgi:TctA family transporter
MADVLSNIVMGFGVALTWQNIGLCFFGCLIGTAIGVLPGIGPLTTMAMILPVTFWIPPVGALIMLAGVFYGAQYGGSTTAILVKIPGETSSVITILDGYAMAQRGRAGPALAIAALGSLFAGSVVTLIIAIGGRRSPRSRCCSIGGLCVGHGSWAGIGGRACSRLRAQGGRHDRARRHARSRRTDVSTGEYRMTMGLDVLYDGIGFVPLSMGLFGLAEIMVNLESGSLTDMQAKKVTGLWPTLADLKQSFPAMVRGTMIGTVFGIARWRPTIAAFSAYSLEKKVSRTRSGSAMARSRRGRPGIRQYRRPGLLHSDAEPRHSSKRADGADDRRHDGAWITRPEIISKQPALFWGLIASMWLGNLMLVVLNLPLIGIWVRLLQVPYSYLFSSILILCCIGTYTLSSSIGDVLVMTAFGVIGYAFRKLDCEPAPLLLGLVLGPMLEENFRRAMVLADGDWSVFVRRPISLGFLLLAAALLLTMALPNIRRRREEAFHE